MNAFYDHAPSIALVFFFVAFLWIAFRTYRPRVKAELQAQALIPLQEDR